MFGVIAGGFDLGQWALDIWHRMASDPDSQTHALLALIALCACKLAFGRKHPPQRSKATLDLPAGETGYIQIGDDEEEEDE